MSMVIIDTTNNDGLEVYVQQTDDRLKLATAICNVLVWGHLLLKDFSYAKLIGPLLLIDSSTRIYYTHNQLIHSASKQRCAICI